MVVGCRDRAVTVAVLIGPRFSETQLTFSRKTGVTCVVQLALNPDPSREGDEG